MLKGNLSYWTEIWKIGIFCKSRGTSPKQKIVVQSDWHLACIYSHGLLLCINFKWFAKNQKLCHWKKTWKIAIFLQIRTEKVVKCGLGLYNTTFNNISGSSTCCVDVIHKSLTFTSTGFLLRNWYPKTAEYLSIFTISS